MATKKDDTEAVDMQEFANTVKETVPMWEALLKLQGELPSLQKNGINPHFKSKYITLENLMEQTLPIVNKYGFIWLTFPTTLAGEPALSYRLIYSFTGESLDGLMPLLVKSTTPQDQGSAITYARRYALMAVLGLVADQDDDGTKAQAAAKEEAKTAKDSISSAKETKIYTMLQRLNTTVEAYEDNLTAKMGKPMKITDLTNEQADNIIAAMTAAIQRSLVSSPDVEA